MDSDIQSSFRPPFPLIVLVILILLSTFIFNIVSFGIWNLGGVSMADINATDSILDYSQRIVLRLGLMFNHFGSFLFPAIIWLFIYKRESYFSFLKINKSPEKQLLMWGLLIFCSYPLIASLTSINMSLPLPEWMTSSNEASLSLMKQVLLMEHLSEFLMNLLLVGLLAAVGEELIFRGIIQRQLEQKWNNPHISIWVTALIFGFFHMQFERFLPLVFLGLILGYSYYYSNSLWTTIILHFLNNGLQVVMLYLVHDKGLPDIEKIPEIPFLITLSSIMITLVLFYIIVRHSKTANER